MPLHSPPALVFAQLLAQLHATTRALLCFAGQVRAVWCGLSKKEKKRKFDSDYRVAPGLVHVRGPSLAPVIGLLDRQAVLPEKRRERGCHAGNRGSYQEVGRTLCKSAGKSHFTPLLSFWGVASRKASFVTSLSRQLLLCFNCRISLSGTISLASWCLSITT